MTYFAIYDNGKLISVGYTSSSTTTGVEITQEEYEALSVEITAKAEYVDRVYCGDIAIEDVPAEWQEDVQMQVDAMIADFGPYDPNTEPEITDEEALAIIQGVSA